ncbi:ABC transporter substrate-binding protein [Streptomyces avidinii]
MDISKVEILGNVYDEFNVEKYAALQPDLLVTYTWTARNWTRGRPPRTRS